MIDDPIVEEVYEIRQRILDQYGGDLGMWMEHLRNLESHHAGRVVTLETMGTNNGRQNTGAELVAHWENEGLIGTRPDIQDPVAHARDLRERVEKRERS